MQYRFFGKLNWKVSALGFGCMRLPTTDGKISTENIDEPEAIKMIRIGIERGINYIDTAYPYHGGQSEILVGKALQDGFREKVKLATKSPVWLLQKAEDFEKYLNEQLQKLQTERIDFYLLHALNKERWKNIILKLNILNKVESALKDGRIGTIGFSFHDNYETFQQIVDGYNNWTFCQIQYNYMDINNQAGIKGLQYAASKGLAVVVMEPLLGGKLAKPPQSIQSIFDNLPTRRSAVDWALQWLWNQPEVSVVLSGMSTMQQVEENLLSADHSAIGALETVELEAIDRVRQAYLQRFPIACTKCAYCLPCPQGVAIPTNFELYNNAIAYDDLAGIRNTYKRFVAPAERAGSCIGCRTCEEKCPQKIQISEWLRKVHSALQS